MNFVCKMCFQVIKRDECKTMTKNNNRKNRYYIYGDSLIGRMEVMLTSCDFKLVFSLVAKQLCSLDETKVLRNVCVTRVIFDK